MAWAWVPGPRFRRVVSRRMRVDIRVLGSFDVVVDGIAIARDEWRRKQPTRLVKLLASSAGHRMHREQVIDVLWPEVLVSDAAPRLHKAAHYARATLGVRDAITLADDTVALFPAADLDVDVDRFDALEQAARSTASVADAEAAIAVYGGDLLPDDPYEEWAIEPRERRRLRFLELLRQAERWEALVAADATDEDAHLHMVRSFMERGDRAGALRQLDFLDTVLRRELGVEPGGVAVALREQVLAMPVEPIDVLANSPGRAVAVPRPATVTIGRYDEIARVGKLVDEAPIVTLLGPGGVGKTRLATEVALRRAEERGIDACFVDLTRVRDAALVPGLIVRDLGVHLASESDALTVLHEVLRGRVGLLVLDNFEHVVDAAPIVGQIIGRAPICGCSSPAGRGCESPVRPCSTSSRSPPRQAPTASPMPFSCSPRPRPRSIPGSSSTPTSPMSPRSAARSMGYRWPSSSPPATCARCHRSCCEVGCMPGSVRRARQPGTRPTGSSRSRPRSTGACSCSRTPSASSSCGSACSSRGCRSSPSRRCARNPVSMSSTPSGGWSTRASSSARSVAPSRASCCSSCCAHARDLLGDETEVMRGRHADYVRRFVADVDERRWRELSGSWIDRISGMLAEIRAAHAFAVERDDVELAVHLTAGLGTFWHREGHHAEGHTWVDHTLAHAGALDEWLQAHVLLAAGFLEWPRDLTLALAHWDAATESFRRLGDDRYLSYALALSSGCFIGDAERYEEGLRRSDEGIALARTVGELPLIAQALNVKGELTRVHGDDDTALTLYEEGLDLAIAAGDQAHVTVFLANLSYLADHRRDFVAARELSCEALRLCRVIGRRMMAAWTLSELAGPEIGLDRPERGALFVGAADVALAALGARRHPGDRPEHDRVLESLRDVLGERRLRDLMARGAKLSLDTAIDLALTDEWPRELLEL